jgi:integrase
MTKLKDRSTVSALTLPEGKNDFIFWDDDLPRFGVRIRRRPSDGTQHGRYLIQYRVGGKQKWVTVGDSAVLTPAQARDKARQMLASVELGGDPAGEKQAARAAAAVTFKAVVEQYIAAERATWSKDSLSQKLLYLTRGDYCRALYSRPISSIVRKDIAAVINGVRAHHSDNTGKQTRKHLSALFSWALGQGIATQEANPVLDTHEPKSSGPRQRALRPDELKAVWDACESAGEYGKLVRLLILTGCRRDEIGELRWSWFAPDMSSFTIPKTKNGTSHTVPVTPLMRSIFDTVPRMVDRDQLFGVWAEKGFADWSAGKLRLGDGLAEPWQLRDLRRTMRTGLGKLKVAPHISELAINHKKRGLIATYDTHTYADEIADAFARWSDHVRIIITEGKVVPLRAS